MKKVITTLWVICPLWGIVFLIGIFGTCEQKTHYEDYTQTPKKKELVPPEKLQVKLDEAKKKLETKPKEISKKPKSVKVIEVRKPAKHALEDLRSKGFLSEALIPIMGIDKKHIRTGSGMEYADDETGPLFGTEKLYVLEEKDGWIRFRVTEKDLGWFAWIRRDLTVKTISNKQAKLQGLHQWVQEALAEGVFHSVNVEYNEVRIDPEHWSFLLIEDKQNIVTCFSQYFDLKGSTGRVTIRSKYFDEKLASYSVWTGIKIYK